MLIGIGKEVKIVTGPSGIMVAVGDSGQISYSTDGASWTNVTLSGSPTAYTVAYAAGKFIAAGQNFVAYSTDGMNWTKIFKAEPWKSIAYGNSKFVIVGGSGVLYSSDGVTWSETFSVSATSVIFKEGKFIAIGGNGIYYSTNGSTWTSSYAGYNNFNGIAYYNGTTVAVGSENYYSTNDSSFNYANGLNGEYYDVIYANGKFVAVGGNGAAYSTDGINWTENYSVYGTKIIYENNKFVSIYPQSIYYSTDGINWSISYPIGSGSGNFTSIKYFNGKFVAFQNYSGTSTKAYYSSNLSSWTATSGLASTGYNAVTSNI